MVSRPDPGLDPRELLEVSPLFITCWKTISKVLSGINQIGRGYPLPCTVIVGGFFGDEGKDDLTRPLEAR